MRTLLARSPWALLGLAAAVVPCMWMWGFTVDDALISVRYARNVAHGLGYRFNAGGPATDGVTPLPWPWLLVPFARGSAMGVLGIAKGLGLVAWASASAALGMTTRSLLLLVALAVSLPVAAHAVSGMETGLAMALATFASLALPRRPTTSAILAGLAASLRPEMLPWAVIIGGGAAWGRAALPWLLSLLPFGACVAARLLVFGRPAPLAVMAKPSDLSHGALYAASALLVAGAPLLLLAPMALRRAPPAARVLALGFVVHTAVIVAVGGDWMPYARLMAPVVPSVIVCASLLGAHAHRTASLLRGLLAIGLGAFFFLRAGPAGRSVQADRARLVEEARAHLEPLGSVAALDIGWVSAATGARIIDLAGLTDPEIAALPGGHTSKRVDAAYLLSRNPDAILLYEPHRVVEERLSRSDLIAAHFQQRAFFPLGAGGYVLLTRR
jgi:hypothetical protein